MPLSVPGHHRHRDLLLHRRLERVHLRLHLPLQERPADAAGRHPALLLGEHHRLAGPDGRELHDERAGGRALPRPADAISCVPSPKAPSNIRERRVAEVVLKHVNKTYGTVAAVNDVSFAVEHGEFVALVGPSGCGKTTTLNLIAGLIQLTSGEIFIGDREVSRPRPQGPRHRHGVPELRALPATRRCSRTSPSRCRCASSRRPRSTARCARRRRCSTSPTCSSASRASSPAASSSAWRSAARWCATRRVFLMDEPLSNLDAKLRVQMRSEIKRFHQNLDATIVYVTHDQLEAVTMADKMAVMHGGLLQQYDTPARVFADPVNTFVAGFVGSPAMSLIPVEIATAGGRTVLRGAERLGAAALRRERPQGRRPPAAARRCSAPATRRSGCARRRAPAPSPAASTPSSRPATSPSPRSSSTARSSTSACRPPSRSSPTSAVWIEFDQDAPAPLRRRNHQGAQGRLNPGTA